MLVWTAGRKGQYSSFLDSQQQPRQTYLWLLMTYWSSNHLFPNCANTDLTHLFTVLLWMFCGGSQDRNKLERGFLLLTWIKTTLILTANFMFLLPSLKMYAVTWVVRFVTLGMLKCVYSHVKTDCASNENCFPPFRAFKKKKKKVSLFVTVIQMCTGTRVINQSTS